MAIAMISFYGFIMAIVYVVILYNSRDWLKGKFTENHGFPQPNM